MTELDDLKAFGDFLSQAWMKSDKSLKQLKAELGVTCIEGWHQSDLFPSKERLPQIARAYGVELEELSAAYERAKAARKALKESRRGSSGRRMHLKMAANYDLPSAGRVSGRCHSFRNSGGR